MDINDKAIPNLRFPKFIDSGSWNEVLLGDIAYIFQGFGFPERMQGKHEGKYPFYKVSDISNAVINGKMFIDEAFNYVDDDDVSVLKAEHIPVGTTIFAKIGEAIKLNRRVITTKECLTDNNTAGVKAKPQYADDLFLYYIMSNINLSDYAGGAVPAVKKSTIEHIPILIPSLAEQKKIAEFIFTVDENISSTYQKLNQMKGYKKGIIQQLFPNKYNL